MLFVTKHCHVLQILISYTRAMGRFSDVVWHDLSVTFRMGRLHSYSCNTIVRRQTIPMSTKVSFLFHQNSLQIMRFANYRFATNLRWGMVTWRISMPLFNAPFLLFKPAFCIWIRHVTLVRGNSLDYDFQGQEKHRHERFFVHMDKSPTKRNAWR